MCSAVISLTASIRKDFRPVGTFAVLAAILAIAPPSLAAAPPTPLENANYTRLTTSQEISDYLKLLAEKYPNARVESIGTTVEGRPLEAIVLAGVPAAKVDTPDRLTIEIIGSQHGMESAGAESLLFVARDLLAGPLRHILDDADVVLIPNANPDGREASKRMNANNVNINVDFVAMSQPETQALVGAIHRYRPEVALDVHESAILKRKSLAKEGYMTDFSAQFEIANNPSVAAGLRKFGLTEILAPWIAGVDAAGLRSARYIGEIKSARQPVTNGGLTLRNLRNRTGIEGTLSFLMETRLDPKDGVYPTFRNIGQRVQMQRICIERFLNLAHAKRAEALAVVAAAPDQVVRAPLVLDARYVGEPGLAKVAIDLRRIADNQLESIEFADHRTVVAGEPLPMPAAYVVRDHQDEIGAWLERHGVEIRTLDAPRSMTGVEFDAGPAAALPDATLDKTRQRDALVEMRAGDLWVDLDQPRARLAALLLEPRSTSCLFRTPEHYPLVSPGKTLPVCRIPR
jgi:hypothetical protein